MPATILIVDDEELARRNIGDFLTNQGNEVIQVATLNEARDCINKGYADIILLDVQLPDGYGPDLLEEVAQAPSRPPIILITAYGDIDMAVEAMKNGALDFIQKPVKFDRLENSVRRAKEIVAIRRELDHLRATQRDQLDFVIGQSESMKSVVDYAQRAASASASVLLTGETGTGKEVLARAIQKMGPRSKKSFVGINCAAVQSTVLESELFGHEPGAFTSAEKRKPGLMETADEGILFLDEISSMSADMQAKLLRVLEEREFRRVGGTTLIRVDVQIIAASNQDLNALLEKGSFREDLFFRLRVVDIHIPPLRERREDIPELVGLFIKQNNPRMGMNVTGVNPKAMEALLRYHWRGNIRELRNVIERAMILCDDPSIDITHLPAELQNQK